nr:3,9-dihydroxypterocarpan 6a-monooxygenase [Quercus suber]
MLRDLDLFFWVLWSIWGNRNQAIHNDTATSPYQTWELVKRAFLDFNEARLNPMPSPPLACNHWTAPPLGFFKINVDGATDPGGGNSCIGVVIRDSSGSPFGALSLVLPSCFPAETTEAIALHHGVHFAVEMQVSQAMFEFDALSIILALNSGATGSDIGHILEDIREASSIFSHCSFHHLKRDGNRAAHSLAKEAKFSGQSHIWKGISPPCLCFCQNLETWCHQKIEVLPSSLLSATSDLKDEAEEMEMGATSYFSSYGQSPLSTILVRYITRTRTKGRVPPSPLALPSIGHLHLLAPLPHQALHNLSNRYGPLIHLFLGSVLCVVVSTPEMAKELLKTHETSFMNRPHTATVDYLTYGSADFSFAPYGPYWKFMKNLCMSKLLVGQTLDQLLPVRHEEITRFVQFILKKGSIR